MFERYTEKARRVIFFARYEASQYGSQAIETEHLLLGLLREDGPMSHRFLPPSASFESIKQRIGTPTAEKVSTSVDLPLSRESKRVLAYGAEEADRFGHRRIGTEHLFLGLMCEEECSGAVLLKEYGLDLAQMRLKVAETPDNPVSPRRDKVRPSFYVSAWLRRVIREEVARCLHSEPVTDASETPSEPEELVSLVSVSRAVLRKMIEEEIARNAPGSSEDADASSAADPESPAAG